MSIPKELKYITAFLFCVLLVSIIFRQPEFQDKNCGDFDVRSEMLKEFKKYETDVHHLDLDGDGIPCENLK